MGDNDHKYSVYLQYMYKETTKYKHKYHKFLLVFDYNQNLSNTRILSNGKKTSSAASLSVFLVLLPLYSRIVSLSIIAISV